jgi:hypothetical protein
MIKDMDDCWDEQNPILIVLYKKAKRRVINVSRKITK